MRQHVKDQIVAATGQKLSPVYGRGSRECYRLGGSAPLGNGGDLSPTGEGHVHDMSVPRSRSWGNRYPRWIRAIVSALSRLLIRKPSTREPREPGSFLILQCGLDFTVIVPVTKGHPYTWSTWQWRMGQSQHGQRLQQHIHWRGESIYLEEGEFELQLSPHKELDGSEHPGWVNNFDLLCRGDLLHLYTNKPAPKSGSHRVYYFGNSTDVWG